MSKTYTLSQAINITGVPQPRLQTWLREEYIEPAEKGEGSGSRSGFDFRNLCQIKLFDYLIKNGMRRDAAVVHIKQLPSSDSLQNDHRETNFLLAAGDLKNQKTTIRQHSFKSGKTHTDLKIRIEHDPDTFPDGWTDVVTLYCLKRIVFEVMEGIEAAG